MFIHMNMKILKRFQLLASLNVYVCTQNNGLRQQESELFCEPGLYIVKDLLRRCAFYLYSTKSQPK